MASTILTLTTDFGDSGGYVGAMKGVALSIGPDLSVVDISHRVPPQDISHGAFVIGTACRYFPPDAVHVCVVDPGVGTSRRPLLVVTPGGRFVAPDNGLLTYVLGDSYPGWSPAAPGKGGFMQPVVVGLPDGCAAYELTRAEYWRHPVSNTFHGRDVFVPAAAHLALGVPPEQLGEPVGSVVCLNAYPPVVSPGYRRGPDRIHRPLWQPGQQHPVSRSPRRGPGDRGGRRSDQGAEPGPSRRPRACWP